MAQTQAQYDDIVLGIADHEVRLAYIATQMRRQNDPDCNRREEELMMLQNILYGLRNYDITADILTEAEIKYYYELATNIAQNCPL